MKPRRSRGAVVVADPGQAGAASARSDSGATIVQVARPKPLLDRLDACRRSAELGGRHAEAAALNAVIVAVSDAKHKARQARGAVAADLLSLLDELEAL